MREVIMEKLREIALKEDVKIIYAAESGSRAWGFESPDSDYDVRFIYVRKQEDYLRILPRRDVIEWQLDETLDINGWDIQKAMLLLLKSNPTLFEWANSPIVYQTTQQWESLKEIINQYFSLKSGVYHYLHMAGRNYREFLKTDQVKQKKYLYVLRPILACRWILRTQTPPPMGFESLVRAEMEPELLPLVMQLLENKRKSSELKTIARIQPLNDYIEKQLETLHAAVVSMPKETHHDVDLLNEHFREIVLSDMPPFIQFAKAPAPKAKKSELIAFLKMKGLSYEDKTLAGGAFWIAGGKGIQPIIQEIETLFGITAQFAETPKALKKQPGWYYSAAQLV